MKLTVLALVFGAWNSLAFTIMFLLFALDYHAYEPNKLIALSEATLACTMLIATVAALIRILK